tara:strand:- start:208 stop:594 length:387 start_codon:yes stop_codon:yes gene_type:complete
MENPFKKALQELQARIPQDQQQRAIMGNRVPGLTDRDVAILRQGFINRNDPMMGETFLQMYERLKKEQGAEPFMPSYAYDSLNKEIKGKENELQLASSLKNDDTFAFSKNKLNNLKKELEKLYGLRGS